MLCSLGRHAGSALRPAAAGKREMLEARILELKSEAAGVATELAGARRRAEEAERREREAAEDRRLAQAELADVRARMETRGDADEALRGQLEDAKVS